MHYLIISSARRSFNQDTKSNLIQSFAVAARYKITKLVFVSDPLHLFRISNLANQMSKQSDFEFRAAGVKYANENFFYKWWRFNKEMLAFLLYSILPDNMLDGLLQNFRK